MSGSKSQAVGTVTTGIAVILAGLTAAPVPVAAQRATQKVSPKEKAESLFLLRMLALEDCKQQLAELPAYSDSKQRPNPVQEAPQLKKNSKGDRLLWNLLDELGRKTGIDIFGGIANEKERQNRRSVNEEERRIRTQQRRLERQQRQDDQAIKSAENRINSNYLRVTKQIDRELNRMVIDGEIKAPELREARKAAIKQYEQMRDDPLSQNEMREVERSLAAAIALAESTTDAESFTMLNERRDGDQSSKLQQDNERGGYRVILRKEAEGNFADRILQETATAKTGRG